MGDGQVAGAQAAYADPVTETLLLRLQPRVEWLCERRLFPTYSYVRVYGSGCELTAHVDRAACEVSVSLSLGQEPATPWPLWMRVGDRSAALELTAGDAAVYFGMECLHWREPYGGDRLVQVFLHYVDANGRHSDLKFDRRAGVGIIPTNAVDRTV